MAQGFALPLALLLLGITGTCLAHPQPNPAADPRPQESNEDRRTIQSTDLCNEVQFQTLLDDFSNCSRTAMYVITEALLSGKIFEEGGSVLYKKVVCKGWSGVMTCLDNILPRCFDEEGIKEREFRYLTDYFYTAYNDTDLGADFISGCPMLNEDRSELMIDLTGSDRCTYVEYDITRKTFSTCIDNVVEQRDKSYDKVDLLPSSDDQLTLISLIECKSNTRLFNECVPIGQSCLGAKEKEEYLEGWRESIQERNERYKAADDRFEYESCNSDPLSDLEAF